MAMCPRTAFKKIFFLFYTYKQCVSIPHIKYEFLKVTGKLCHDRQDVSQASCQHLNKVGSLLKKKKLSFCVGGRLLQDNLVLSIVLVV